MNISLRRAVQEGSLSNATAQSKNLFHFEVPAVALVSGGWNGAQGEAPSGAQNNGNTAGTGTAVGIVSAAGGNENTNGSLETEVGRGLALGHAVDTPGHGNSNAGGNNPGRDSANGVGNGGR